MATNNAINANQTLSTTSAVTFNTVIAQAGYAQHSISGVTTLTSTDYGKQVLCTGSSAYTVTLPAQVAGKYIDINILTTSNALVTLSPASGTIQGQSTFVLGSNESCRIYTDGTNWWVENLVLQPVYAVVGCTSATAISSGPVKVPYNSSTYDLGSFWDLVTNFRYTPKYPGKYMITAACNANCTASNQINSYIYKNGGSIFACQSSFANASGNVSTIVTGIAGLNGSTDYIEGFAAGPATSALTTNPATTFMTIQRISNI